MHRHLPPLFSLVEVETLPSGRVLLSLPSSVLWSPPTSHPASSWISLLELIPVVTTAVSCRPNQISPVPSPPFPTSRSPYAGRLFAAASTGSSPLPWPSLLLDELGSLLLPFRGQPFDAARFTLCYGLLFCFPFSGSYIASAQPVTRLHWMPATWPPVRYQDWTFTN